MNRLWLFSASTTGCTRMPNCVTPPGAVIHAVKDYVDTHFGEWFDIPELERVLDRYAATSVQRAIHRLIASGSIERRSVPRPSTRFGQPGIRLTTQVRSAKRADTCDLRRGSSCAICGIGNT